MDDIQNTISKLQGDTVGLMKKLSSMRVSVGLFTKMSDSCHCKVYVLSERGPADFVDFCIRTVGYMWSKNVF